MKYYLGIDGGGTRTTAAISDEKGNVLFKAVGKSINFYSVGMEKARENLKDVINDIYKNIGEIEFESALGDEEVIVTETITDSSNRAKVGTFKFIS